MNIRIIALVGVLLMVLAGSYIGYSYFAIGKPVQEHAVLVRSSQTPATAIKDLAPVTPKLELVAENLFVPWSIVFTSPTRLLVTERNGNVRVIENGKLKEKPLHTFTDVSQKQEEGLMGMALHPKYHDNKFIYFAYAYSKGTGMAVRIVRFTDEGSSLSGEKVILENLPAAQYHAGTRIKFGPDKKLYISTGDATEKEKAQDLAALNGKILRVNDDGSFPADNPFPNSPVYSYGHRNSQGFDWHPETNVMYETEHGPSQIDGPAGGDELNVIVRGGNYGWPQAHHEIHINGRIDPKIVYTPAVAPADMTFNSGKMFPQFKNNFFFAALKGEGIYRVVISASNASDIASYDKMTEVAVGRIREVVEAPDGAIYFATSNRDNRGTLQQNDDKIYKLTK